MSTEDYPSDDDQSFTSAISRHDEQNRFSPEEEAVGATQPTAFLFLSHNPTEAALVFTPRIKHPEDIRKLSLRTWRL